MVHIGAGEYGWSKLQLMEQKAGKSSASAKSVPTGVVHSWSTGHHRKDPCWNNLWRTIPWERLQAKVGEQYEEATTEKKCYEQVPKPILHPTLIHSWGRREDRRMEWSWINEDRIKELSLGRRKSICLVLFLAMTMDLWTFPYYFLPVLLRRESKTVYEHCYIQSRTLDLKNILHVWFSCRTLIHSS